MLRTRGADTIFSAKIARKPLVVRSRPHDPPRVEHAGIKVKKTASNKFEAVFYCQFTIHCHGVLCLNFIGFGFDSLQLVRVALVLPMSARNAVGCVRPQILGP